jgi:hypothetical protein
MANAIAPAPPIAAITRVIQRFWGRVELRSTWFMSQKPTVLHRDASVNCRRCDRFFILWASMSRRKLADHRFDRSSRAVQVTIR